MKVKLFVECLVFSLLSVVASREKYICESICLCENISEKFKATATKMKAICTSLPQNVQKNITSLTIRGNLQSISIDDLSNLTSVTTLDFGSTNIFSISEEAFSKLQFLEVLRLSDNRIQDISHSTFKGSEQLKELYLDNNNLKVIDDDAFSSLISLKILNLSSNILFDIPLSLPNGLLFLDVSHNQIKQTELKVINLISLNLCGNPMLIAPDLIYKQPQLENLCLGGNLLHMSSRKLVWPKIKTIALSAKNMTQTVFTHAMQFTIGQLTSLTSLQIENYKLDSLEFLTGLGTLTQIKLEKIQMTRLPNIDDIIKKLPLLESLNLDSSPELAKLFLNANIGLSRLQTISLRNADITTIHQSASKKILKSTFKIDLRGNPLDCDSKDWDWLIQRLKYSNETLINSREVTCQINSFHNHSTKVFLEYLRNNSEVEPDKDTLQSSTASEAFEPQYNESKADAQHSSFNCNAEKYRHICYIVTAVFVAVGIFITLQKQCKKYKERKLFRYKDNGQEMGNLRSNLNPNISKGER